MSKTLVFFTSCDFIFSSPVLLQDLEELLEILEMKDLRVSVLMEVQVKTYRMYQHFSVRLLSLRHC